MFFHNFDFLISQSAHFDCIVNLPFFVLKISEFKDLDFFYTLHNKSIIKYIIKGNVLVAILNHARRLFYQKTFYQSNTQHILILLLLFCLKLRLVFLDVYIQCVFHSFHNKFACFVIFKTLLFVRLVFFYKNRLFSTTTSTYWFLYN